MSKTLDYYNANAGLLSVSYESADIDSFHESMSAHFKPGSRLLELGCGSGRDASRALKAGYDLTAIDGSAELLAEAQRLHPELAGRLLCLRLPCSLPFNNTEFDGFFSVACLMHFDSADIQRILAEIHRVVRADGRGIVSVPSCRGDVDNNGLDEHGRVFNLRPAVSWQKLFAQCGFITTATSEQADSLGRSGIFWLNFFLQRAP